MGAIKFFQGLMKPQAQKQSSRVELFSAYEPVFRTWSGKVYESQLVRQSIEAHAKQASKLKFSMTGSAKQRLRAELRRGPNEFETWPDFFERCSNIYRTENNLFISPVLDEFGELRGYWPLYPSNSEVRIKDGITYLVFQFANGKTMAMEIDKIGRMKRNQLGSDWFGEPNTPLNDTLEMDAMTVQGIIEGIKNASGYQFMAELQESMFEEDVKKARERFDELNFGKKTGGRGLLLFNGNLKNAKQLEAQKMPVDAEQMKLIRENVFAYFGTNEEILTNAADSVKQDAFYNNETEPFLIKLGTALTRMTFTPREEQAGNGIILTSNQLQYMSPTEKVSVAKELGDRGALMIDEIRELFNYPPLADGKGQHAPIRGEYYYAGEDREGKDDKKDTEEE